MLKSGKKVFGAKPVNHRVSARLHCRQFFKKERNNQEETIAGALVVSEKEREIVFIIDTGSCLRDGFFFICFMSGG